MWLEETRALPESLIFSETKFKNSTGKTGTSPKWFKIPACWTRGIRHQREAESCYLHLTLPLSSSEMMGGAPSLSYTLGLTRGLQARCFVGAQHQVRTPSFQSHPALRQLLTTHISYSICASFLPRGKFSGPNSVLRTIIGLVNTFLVQRNKWSLGNVARDCSKGRLKHRKPETRNLNPNVLGQKATIPSRTAD